MRDFVNRVLEKWFRLPFSSEPRIISCKIISSTNSMGVIQRHGLIIVLPDDAALGLFGNSMENTLVENALGYDNTTVLPRSRLAI
jgi:hypothetical protein